MTALTAVLSNAKHPEYGVVSIPFPIPRQQYGHCIGLAEALEIGGAVLRDCKVEEVRGPWPVLKRLEGSSVNVDELDYLAKRLDGFDVGEAAQFQAMAEKLKLSGMTDLINLTLRTSSLPPSALKMSRRIPMPSLGYISPRPRGR